MNPAPSNTASTRVVHCKRARYDVYIGRPSKWGNPYVIGPDGTREQVIAKYSRPCPVAPESHPSPVHL